MYTAMNVSIPLKHLSIFLWKIAGAFFRPKGITNHSYNPPKRHFEQRDNGEIYFFDRIWIPSVGGVRKLIMDEAHTSRYSVHPGADKMYYDLRDLYWWPGMKRDIAEYVSRCLTCSKIKAEHQKPSGFLQQPEIPEWKWEKITMDFVTKLPKSSNGEISKDLYQ
ncbi:putative reverse transcriptase domain-containing protein [Tanacetum coccineum]